MTLEGPRLLAKTLTGTTATNDGTTLGGVTGQWDIVAGSPNAAVQRDYFDLSGYNMDLLTTFIQRVDIQDPGPLAGTDQNNGLIELITTEFVSDADIAAWTGGFLFSGPGYSLSTMSMDQVIFGRRRQYTFDGGILPLIPNLHSVNVWGTASAITSDKLHLTRIVLSSTTPGSVTHVSDTVFVVGVIVSKEKELPFLMRQKRSYELATGP